MPTVAKHPGRRTAGILALLCVLALVGVGVAYTSSAPRDRSQARDAIGSSTEPAGQDPLLEGPLRLALWLTCLALVLLGWLCTGRAFSDSWGAIFISRNNRASLSQVQFVLWTVLFASATLALFLIRFRALRGTDALGFSFPTEAALLMGVSSVSFGGAQVIAASKRAREPTAKDVEKAVRATLRDHRPDIYPKVKAVAFGKLLDAVPGDKAKDPAGPPSLAKPALDAVRDVADELASRANGVLAREPKGGARLVHLVQGDEITNRDHMDLGKVQLAFFSLLAIVAYFLLLWRLFLHGSFLGDGPSLATLPKVSEGLVALLGASSVGYLGSKAAGATRARE